MGGRVLESLLKVTASADDLSALDVAARPALRPGAVFIASMATHALKVPLVSSMLTPNPLEKSMVRPGGLEPPADAD